MIQTFFIWSGVLFWVLVISFFSWIFYDDWKEKKKERKLYKTAFKQLEEQGKMYKKLILLALVAVIMAGCDGTQRNQDDSIVLDDYWKQRCINNPFKVVIDSCEYICWHGRMAHKGNCRFCDDRRKKELNLLIKQIKEE